ncbi:MAG: Rieske 2Fe-2S domain-containing protein, partial [Aestuariivita sp.]|nr:Rieske 2Fe-2S domain-containing protein [Aestuariivita sp.]
MAVRERDHLWRDPFSCVTEITRGLYMLNNLYQQWFPIASSTDLVPRHVYQAQLFGREFAVWRADDGYVNVWENRCLHRGVRLSIGINDGRELKCQYHGWRYANRTAGCTYIPAHPADAPARTICNNTYPAKEAYGLIWAGEEASGPLPNLGAHTEGIVLRPIPVHAPAEMIKTALQSYDPNILCFVQPCDSDHCIIRGIAKPGGDRVALLHQHSFALCELRDRVEADATLRNAPTRYKPVITKVAKDLADIPNTPADGRTADLSVTVTAKDITGKDIARLRLEPLKCALPTFQPGAHIDVHLQNGLVRQYSLTNGPGETDHYTIGVKLEPDSRGGSSTIHALNLGDNLAISMPRNNFPLRRDAVMTILIAGGIGMTPLLSMARALNIQGLPFAFHYFVQSDDHIAFSQEIREFADVTAIHKGLSPEDTSAKLSYILAEPGPARHVYICGPGPMLDTARGLAIKAGWSDTQIHFEYFKNNTERDTSGSFEIDLARSALTL